MKKSKPLIIFTLFIFISVIAGILFSHHGLVDLIRFSKLIEATKERVAIIESENQALRQRIEAFENDHDKLIEFNLRSKFGWVKPNELIYYENIE